MIREWIIYFISCLVSNRIKKLLSLLILSYVNQRWNIISGGIYYLTSFLYLLYMRYINPKLKYKIYIFHVAQIYFFNQFLFFILLITKLKIKFIVKKEEIKTFIKYIVK